MVAKCGMNQLLWYLSQYRAVEMLANVMCQWKHSFEHNTGNHSEAVSLQLIQNIDIQLIHPVPVAVTEGKTIKGQVHFQNVGTDLAP